MCEIVNWIDGLFIFCLMMIYVFDVIDCWIMKIYICGGYIDFGM